MMVNIIVKRSRRIRSFNVRNTNLSKKYNNPFVCTCTILFQLLPSSSSTSSFLFLFICTSMHSMCNIFLSYYESRFRNIDSMIGKTCVSKSFPFCHGYDLSLKFQLKNIIIFFHFIRNKIDL